MNILVTGGLGYIGIELVRELSLLGMNVYIIDIDLYSRAKLFSSDENVFVIKEDIRFVDWSILNRFSINAVYHLAGISNDPGNGVSTSLGREINLNASVRMYEFLKDSNVKTFIYPSSCSVYGKSNLNNVDENSCTSPITNYAKLKLEFENYIRHNINLNVSNIILRPATVFGPSKRQRLDLLGNKLISNLMINRLVELPDIKNCRPLVYIKDLIGIYILLLNENIQFDIYNIAFYNMSIEKTINEVSKVINKEAKISSKGVKDSRSYLVNSSKIIKRFPEFSPTDLKKGILETEVYFRNEKIVNDLENDVYYNNKIQAKKWGEFT